MLKERILSKVSIPQLVFWWVFRLIIISPLVFSWYSPHENIKLQIMSSFTFSFAWEILQLFPKKTLVRKISSHFQDFTIFQIFLTSFLGAFKDFYYTVWWWDSATHIIGGGLCIALGYEIVTAIQKKYKSTVPIGIIIFAAFGFSFFAGTLWELFEFSFDQLTGSDSQHWNYANAESTYSLFSYTPERFPIMDTMIDMICNTVGTIIFTIILAKFPYHHKGKNNTNEMFINKENDTSKETEMELLTVNKFSR